MKDTDSINALAKIFKRKNWFNIDDDDHIFDTFCDLLNILEPEERALLIELTANYYWIPGGDYPKDIKEVIKGVPQNTFEGIKDILLFPIVKPTDDKKTKSGHGLTYDIKAMMPMSSNLRHILPKILEEFSEFDAGPASKTNQLLLLVDDFIGSGDTLDQCLREIESRTKIYYERTLIICISCQLETYKSLTDKGINIYAKYLIKKGITDFNAGTAIDEKKKLMRTIEKSIPGSNSLSLGFMESEALITLKRTPDNTFPVFWMRTKRGGKYYNPPFLREKQS